jgi:hypothetical protein
MKTTASFTSLASRTFTAMVLGAGLSLPDSAVSDTFIVCLEREDAAPSREDTAPHQADSAPTRVVIEMDSEITSFVIVTPEHAWSAPDLPQGETHMSPNLVGRDDVYVKPVKDTDGELRILDFGVRDPDALELEGLRGSLVLHEVFLANHASASLFYTATGNLVSVTALNCEQIPGN